MTKDLLKIAKKDLTKKINKMQKNATKDFNKFDTLLRELKAQAVKEQADIIFSVLLSGLMFENRYTDENLSNIHAIENIELRNNILSVWNKYFPEVLEIRATQKHLEIERERLGYITGIKKTLQEYKSDVDEKEFNKFLCSLDSWKPAENKNSQLYVNGVAVPNGTICGVKIGSGKRIHLMRVQASTRLNKITNIVEDIVSYYNGTRWYQSDVAIIDVKENIPSSIISKII